MVILNDYNVANKNLEWKFKEEELSSNAVLREFRHVENDRGNVRTKTNLLKDKTEEMKASATREKKVQSKICDKIQKRAEPEFPGLAMKVSRSIGRWHV